MAKFNCKGQQPQVPYRPVYLQCWGLGRLPGALLIDVGPVVKNPAWTGPDLCGGYTVKDSAMPRRPCTYTYEWSGLDNFGIVLTTGSFDYSSNTRSEFPVSDTIDQNPLLTDPAGKPRWSVGGSGSLQPGATSWCSRVNGITKLEVVGTYQTETCIGPIRIHYEGP
jgi:hypothetical protein